MTLQEDRPAETVRAIDPSALQTARLTLRPPCFEDARAVAALVNDIRIAQNTTLIPYPYGLSDAHEWLRAINGNARDATYLITLHGGDVIGACGVTVRANGKAELGYWIGTQYWRQGYATEAARAAIDHAFTELGWDELQSGARISNPASRRVLEKCGFQWSGVVLRRFHAINSSAPSDRFRLERGIWSSLKAWRPTRQIA